jgi:hypothetical protein
MTIIPNKNIDDTKIIESIMMNRILSKIESMVGNSL